MIKMSEFAKRRKILMQTMEADDVMILPAAPAYYRNADTHYAYRQDSDFYYLSGLEEPEAVIVLLPNRKQGEFILFNRVRDKSREIWDGPRAGQQGAVKEFGADEAYPISEFTARLPELLVDRKAVHYPWGKQPAFDLLITDAVNKIRAKIRSGLPTPIAFYDSGILLHEMRLFKSSAEIAVMQKAVDITEKAHVHAMQICKPGSHEYELEAVLSYEFQRHGARFPAYTPIVGAGANACVLHYVANNQKIGADDLILIDAGAELHNYAADITRSFPASGKFSGEQRAIYELVLASQLAALKTIKPGALWTAAQTAIIKVLTQGLVDLGILKGSVDNLIEKQAYLPFYMHNSGHWLGLDVHDVGRYRIDGKWRKLDVGMALTVEPGIYISADTPGVAKRWHNIGVRIEDDVVVTEKGHKVLSQAIPKTVAEIEAVMAG